MADLLDAMKKLKMKNEIFSSNVDQYKKDMDLRKSRLVEKAKKNPKVHTKQNSRSQCASLEGGQGPVNSVVNRGAQGNKLVKKSELHIKNLDASVDNDDLRAEFKRFGTITEVRVVRDDSDKSRGFAFLRFNTPDEAHRAMTAMNDEPIRSKVVSISLAEPGPEDTRGAQGNRSVKKNELHIKNLDASVDNDDLRAEFKRFGTITEVRVVRDGSDKSRGFAFLRFNTPDEAHRAMTAMNNEPIRSKVVSISLAELEPGHRERNADKPRMKDKIFVRNLVETIDEDELRTHFGRFGGIVEARVFLDENGKSRGMGVVQFFSKKAAEKAVIEMNGRPLRHVPVFVSFAEIGKTSVAKPKPSGPVSLRNDKIFVANLPPGFGDLRGLFSRFGGISQAKVIAGKCIGFVQFVFAKDAQQAARSMNGYVIASHPRSEMGRAASSKPLRVTLAKNRPGHTDDLFYAPKKATYLDDYGDCYDAFD